VARFTRVVCSAALCVAVGSLLGGCGGSSKTPLTKAVYVKQMKVLGTTLGKSLDSAAAARKTATAATALSAFQSNLRDTAKTLKSITPPAKAAAGHAKLTAGVSDLADELDGVIAKVKGGNLDSVGTVTALKGFAEIQQGGEELSKAGFDIDT
jgi:soluble cytochrome b562